MRCEDCRFSVIVDIAPKHISGIDTFKVLKCRRYPQVVEVYFDYWCGEYLSKPKDGRY